MDDTNLKLNGVEGWVLGYLPEKLVLALYIVHNSNKNHAIT